MLFKHPPIYLLCIFTENPRNRFPPECKTINRMHYLSNDGGTLAKEIGKGFGFLSVSVARILLAAAAALVVSPSFLYTGPRPRANAQGIPNKKGTMIPGELFGETHGKRIVSRVLSFDPVKG